MTARKTNSQPFGDLEADPHNRQRKADVESIPNTITTANEQDPNQPDLANMTEDEKRAVIVS